MKISCESQYSNGAPFVYSGEPRKSAKPACGRYMALKSRRQHAVACLLIPRPAAEDDEAEQGNEIPAFAVRACEGFSSCIVSGSWSIRGR